MPTGKPLWDGPVPADRRGRRARRTASWPCPAATSGSQLLLDRTADGTRRRPRPALPGRSATNAGRDADRRELHAARRWPTGETGVVRRTLDLDRRASTGFGEYTLLIAKRDPGQGLVWLAFALADRRASRSRSTCRAGGSGPASAPDGRLGHRLALRPLRRRRARVRAAARRARRRAPGDLRPARSGMASLHDLPARAVPDGPPGRCGASSVPTAGEREVGWVRVLKSRVPAFDALEAGDLAIIPGPALAVVAPGTGPDRGARRGAQPGPRAGRAAGRGRHRE